MNTDKFTYTTCQGTKQTHTHWPLDVGSYGLSVVTVQRTPRKKEFTLLKPQKQLEWRVDIDSNVQEKRLNVHQQGRQREQSGFSLWDLTTKLGPFFSFCYVFCLSETSLNSLCLFTWMFPLWYFTRTHSLHKLKRYWFVCLSLIGLSLLLYIEVGLSAS